MTLNWHLDLAKLVNDFITWSETPEGHSCWFEIHSAIKEKRDYEISNELNAYNWAPYHLPITFRIDLLIQIDALNAKMAKSNNTNDSWFAFSPKWAKWRVFIRRLRINLDQPPIISFLIEVANQD